MAVYTPPLYFHAIQDVPGVSGAANVYMSLLNPPGSGRLLVARLSSVDSYTLGAAAVGVSLQRVRISSATGGTLVPAADINRASTSYDDPVGEIRTGNPAVVIASLPLSVVAPPITTGAGGTSGTTVSGVGESNILMQPGEGLAMRTGNSDIDVRWNILLAWQEVG